MLKGPDLKHLSVRGSVDPVSWSRDEVEQSGVMVRLELYNRGLPCGPKALRRRLCEHHALRPLPSERTIARILARNGLTHNRTGWYEGDEPPLPRPRMQPRTSANAKTRAETPVGERVSAQLDTTGTRPNNTGRGGAL